MNTDALKKSRFLRALRKQPVDCTPVWIMRQAGRYLPEYRELRKKAGSFLTLCKTPELACEVTLQPLERFPLDAAIIFSDILTIPDAMGLGLDFVEGEGPRFESPIYTVSDIDKKSSPDMDDLRYVFDAIAVTKKELIDRVPLIGFSGSPWTLAKYMIHDDIKKFRFQEPKALQKLLTILTDTVGEYLCAQAEAGADAIMLFDTWGGMLSAEDYQNFSLQHMKTIIERVKQKHRVPITLFTKGGGQWLETMVGSGCDALGLDWMTSISHARKRVGDKVALQGNLDPSALYSSPDKIHEEVARILDAYGQGSGHVFNLGHGIHKDVPPEHVAELVTAVHELSAAYHD